MMRAETNTKLFSYLLQFALFSSGFIIMAIELLGGRILAPFFGASVHIWGSIITVFMLSLAIGYLLGGKLSLKQPNLTKFALLFIAAGILLLPLYSYANEIMQWIFEQIEDSRYGSLLACMLLFTLPTILLGCISPYAIHLLAVQSDNTGQIAGRLYFISTLGSALGTLLTSFYLVLWFEVNQIIFYLMLSLIVLGLGLIAMGSALDRAKLQGVRA